MNIDLAQTIVLRFPQQLVARCHLSVPSWNELNGTVGYCRDSRRASTGVTLPYRGYSESCLVSYADHLAKLNLKPQDPWLLTGIRNLGNNLRIVGWEREKRLLELKGEGAASSGRPYSCLCQADDGGLIIDELSFAGGRSSRNGLAWAASGQKLVWDGKPARIEEIVPYTYDLRHVWRLPGTLVPDMGRAYAGEHIQEMVDKFVDVADQPPEEVATELIKFAKAKGYSREGDYLHSAIGISKDEESIILVQRHGRFEDIAHTLIKAGADRAIELDQGGSCAIMMGGTKEFTPGRTLSASHYFRPRGLALLVFRLNRLDEETFTENSRLLG